jgi:hypothetical protein
MIALRDNLLRDGPAGLAEHQGTCDHEVIPFPRED